MKKAAGATQGFTDSFTSGIASIAKWTSVIAGATAAVGAFFTKLGADRIDSVAKLADRLGGTTEEVAVLQHAADLAGSSAEGMATSLDYLNKTLGDPSKETLEALDKLGLSLGDLLNAGPQRRMEMIADGMQRLGSGSERAAIATDLFGKQGASLLAVLANGSAGIREMERDLNSLGGAFSRAQAARVEFANDAISRTQKALGIFFEKIAIEFAPIVEALANKLTEFIVAGQGLSKYLIPALQSVVKALGTVADALVSVWDGAKSVGGGIKAGASAAVGGGSISGIAMAANPLTAPFAVLRGVQAYRQHGEEAMAQALERGSYAEKWSKALGETLADVDRRAQAIVEEQRKKRLAESDARLKKITDEYAGADMIWRGAEMAQAIAGSGFARMAAGLLSTVFQAPRPVTPLIESEALANIGRDRLRLNELADERFGGSRALAQMFGERGLPERARTVGASGTFGSLGARMTSAQTIAQQQLDVARSQLDVLREIDSGLDAGVPAP